MKDLLRVYSLTPNGKKNSEDILYFKINAAMKEEVE